MNEHDPKDSCLKYESKEIFEGVGKFFQLLTKPRFARFGAELVGEACTCSQDGCNGGSHHWINNYLVFFVSFVFINIHN